MRIRKLYNDYKNVIPYLFFGVCTTGINVAVYGLLAHVLDLGTMFSTIAAWIAAVVFAYLTNRKWVFDSKAMTFPLLLKEITSFFMCRIATGIVDWGCMFLFVNVLLYNDVIIKILSNIIVIIINYVASKYLIFKKEEKQNG